MVTSKSALPGWGLWGSSGFPQFDDITQGQLGDCYYLAGIAAIAATRPELLKRKTFNSTEEANSKMIFQLVFMVDGRETMVAVDEMVPMIRHPRHPTHPADFFFATTKNLKEGNYNVKDHAVWPIVLEKGFAKIFGSYLAIRGGMGYDTLKAMTQAPVYALDAILVDGKNTWEDEEQLWNLLTLARHHRWPMTAGTAPRPDHTFGTVGGHEFVVLSVDEHDEYGRIVQVYNPWGANRYRGELREYNNKRRGDYWMKFNEFQLAFDGVSAARVKMGYFVTPHWFEVGRPYAFKLTMRGNRNFWVNLEWPSSRFVDVLDCRFRRENVILLVAKADSLGQYEIGVQATAYSYVSNLRVEMPGGAGEYWVYVYASFEDANWLEHVVLNTYAAESPTFEEHETDALTVGRSILGFGDASCNTLRWYKFGMTFMDTPFMGSPAWKDSRRGETLYIGTLYGANKLMVVSADAERVYTKFRESELQCAQRKRHWSAYSPSALEITGQSDSDAEALITSKTDECGYQLDEAVWIWSKSQDRWFCGEVIALFDTRGSNMMKVSYNGAFSKRLICQSKSVRKVEASAWQRGDQVYYHFEGDSELAKGSYLASIDALGCGDYTLAIYDDDGNPLRRVWQVPFDSSAIQPVPKDRCGIKPGMDIFVKSTKLKRWVLGRAKRVEPRTNAKGEVGMLVQAQFINFNGRRWISCSNTAAIRELTRCEKFGHEQMARFKTLNNKDAIARGEDNLFPPAKVSIGPEGTDCGDSARGGEAEDCGKFDSWFKISDLLGRYQESSQE